MVNLPDSLYEDYTISRVNLPSALASTVPLSPDIRMIIKWVNDLHKNIPSTFDFALQNLTIHRKNFEILPRLLWKSHFTVAMLLQEILKIYPLTSRPVYSQNWMHLRVYNILLLFQCITHYPETRNCFLKADMQYYFYPLMDINVTDPRLECLRIGALGVIAHMLRPPVDPAAVCYLVNTSCLQHCTKAIEIGSTESKTIAVFIINKILSTGEGLQYCCVLPDRFFFIDGLLKRLLMYLTTMARPCPSLFNLLVGCYTSLSYKPRARRGLRRYLPDMLFNNTFASLLAADPAAERNRRELIKNLEMKTQPEKNRFTK
ncbi:CCR4-NOT transcription complex subunit 9 [Brassica rapa]|uniref:CCR4-NOT transcription complex subunit 9 n=1 Tax=Brassica campestris TaxID=3711 RepID=UPI0004F14453|nr:CCR4-NOT transcription complex subunit 9 [Brassica rapa]